MKKTVPPNANAAANARSNSISENTREARLHSKYGVEFKSSKACAICKSTFGFFLPGHFCRFCGRRICHKCSPTKHKIEGSKHRKRICNECVQGESHNATEVGIPPRTPFFLLYRLSTHAFPRCDCAHISSVAHSLNTFDLQTEMCKICIACLCSFF